MSKKAQILLVDDDEMTLFIHEKIMKRCELPFEFKSFKSGNDCIDYMRAQYGLTDKFILLLDIHMPLMSGWEVMDLMKKEGLIDKSLVVMTTSSVDSYDKQKAETYASVLDFYEKPLTIDKCKNLFNIPEIAELT